jgi:hypothetical protein
MASLLSYLAATEEEDLVWYSSVAMISFSVIAFLLEMSGINVSSPAVVLVLLLPLLLLSILSGSLWTLC